MLLNKCLGQSAGMPFFKSSHEGSPDAAENQRGEHIGHAEPIPESQVDAHAEDEQGADKGETVDNGAAEQGCEKAGKEGDAPLKGPYGKGRKDGPPAVGGGEYHDNHEVQDGLCEKGGGIVVQWNPR